MTCVLTAAVLMAGLITVSAMRDLAIDRRTRNQFGPASIPITTVSHTSQSLLTRTISRSSDDAEEKGTGAMRLQGADLELVQDDTRQHVGLRFQNIWIPQGSTITEATIQFKVDETSSNDTTLELYGELVPHARTFSTTDYDITDRPATQAGVDWEPPAWDTVGEAGQDQRTPNLALIVQEIVNQSGWVSGNAVAIIVAGAGRRVAESYDGVFAPELTVTYEGGDPNPSYAETFACLEDSDDTVDVNVTNRTERYDVETAKDRVFDARDASFRIVETTHGMIELDGPAGHTGMFWAGGYVWGDKPWDASWYEWKYDPATRNSAVIKFDAPLITVTGTHFFNVHDGLRIGESGDGWTIQHVWGEYIRDDAVENDHLRSGRILDCLFDGCTSGISTRPRSRDDTSDGRGELVILNGVLLWMEAMPYPYDYNQGWGIVDKNGDPWDGNGIPYGHGNLFKYDREDISRNPHFVIKNCVFLFTNKHARRDNLHFPPDELIDECSNVTVIWLGSGDYPGELPTNKFPGSVTVLKGQEGLDFWRDKVIDWHQRHPDVDPSRIPSNPGRIDF